MAMPPPMELGLPRLLVFLLVVCLAFGTAILGGPAGCYWWMQFQCWRTEPDSDALRKGADSMKVLIVYYSTYGHVYRMATLVAEGVQEIPGVQPVVRTVPELIPQSVIDSREDMKAGRELQQNVPLVTKDDCCEAGAIAFDTPTRFGNVSAQLKNQIDQLTSLWLKGELEGKPAGVFVSTSSLHGGQETTILTLMAALLHLGDDSRRCPVFHSRTIHHARGWLTLRSGARGGG